MKAMSEHVTDGPDCFPDDACSRCWVKWMAKAVKEERERVLAAALIMSREMTKLPTSICTNGGSQQAPPSFPNWVEELVSRLWDSDV